MLQLHNSLDCNQMRPLARGRLTVRLLMLSRALKFGRFREGERYLEVRLSIRGPGRSVSTLRADNGA